MKKYNVAIADKINRDEIVDFLSKIYGPNYSAAHGVFSTIFDHEPSLSPQNLILARAAKGNLIGVVRIVDRKIFVDGAILECGGISSVGVHPQWREQGICGAMMEKAIKAMTQRGKDVSILHGRRVLDGFYLRFGYYGIGRYVDLEVDCSQKTPAVLGTAPFGQDDLTHIKRLYEEIYPHLTGAFVRNPEVWRYLLALVKNSKGRMKIFTYRKNRKIVGYGVLNEKKMVEMALEQKYFSGAASLNRSLGVDSLSIHPRHPFYVFCRSQFNTTAKERFALDGGYMARVIDCEGLLKKLGPRLAARARELGVSSQVVRLLNYEISLKNGKVYCTNKINDILFRKKEAIVRLLLRMIGPFDVAGIVWNQQKPWIPFLFQGLYYHTDAWDEI